MNSDYQVLIRQLDELKKKQEQTKAAANFLFHSIVELLDEQSEGNDFRDALSEKIKGELAKITMGSTALHKHVINELMQPPIRQMFSNEKPEPFLK